MKKIWIKRLTSFALSLVLLTNSLTPYVLAQEITPSPEPTPTTETTLPSDPVPTAEITPPSDPTPTPEPAVDSVLMPEITSPPVESTPAAVISTGLDSPESQKSATISSPLTKETQDSDTVVIDQVAENVAYHYKDTPVAVTFTHITTPGTLTIREFEPEDAAALGIIGKAYEISSSMEDGTFTYDLTLPLPENNQDLQLEYAESTEDLHNHNTQEVTNAKKVEGNTVTYTGLDHFTIFIFTDDSATYTGGLWIDYATQGYYNDGVHYPATVPAGQTATWTFKTITPGTYNVFISWSTRSNRTTAAPYTLNYNGGSSSFTVNQELLADQSTTGASGQWSGWYSLGAYPLNADSTIVLTSVDNSSGTDYVIADEIMITQAPVITSPANNAILTSANLPKVDWTHSTGTHGPFTYQYQAFSDSAYTINRYGPSSWLSAPEIPTPGTPEGDYYLRVRAKDSLGNITEWSNGPANPHKVTVDNTAPSLTFDLPANGALVSGSVHLKATCNETCDYVNFWWREDGESYDPDSKRYHYVHDNGTNFEWELNTLDALKADGSTYLMTDGTYHLYAAAKDLAGNWARTPDITITVDNSAPDVFLTSPTTATVSDTIPIWGTVTDAHPHHYWLVIQDSGNHTVAGPGTVNDSNSFTDQFFFNWDTTTVPNGNYTIKLEARDALGNKDSGSVAWFSLTVLNDTTVSGIKYHDLNGNGSQDSNEPGLKDWTILGAQQINHFLVTPYDPGIPGIPTFSSVVLDDDQDYIIRVSGTYTEGDSITADAKYSTRLPNTIWTDRVQNYESHGPSLLDLQIDGSSPDWGTYNPNHVYWLPVTGTGSPLNFSLHDIYPSNNAGSLDVSIFKIVSTTTTDTDGDYTLTIPGIIGDVIITEQTQNPWAQTAPSSAPFGYYTITGGSNTSGLDFGNRLATSVISGYKLNDFDGNLQTTDDQTPVPGWSIDLYECYSDFQNCGYVDTQTTDENGFYSFPSILHPGFYQLMEQLQSGWHNLTPPLKLTVDTNQDLQNNNFINNLGSISGIKYQDRDGNGEYDSEVDDPEKDWTIFIDKDGDQDLDEGEESAVTDANGHYEFNQLLGGQTYTVCEVLKDDWYQTDPGNYNDGPGCYTVELEPGQNKEAVNFGNFHFARISGHKFEDLDGDGIWDSGEEGDEKGLADWTINILGPNEYTDSTTTDDNGYYIFDDLPYAGEYTVSEATQSGWIQTAPEENGELGRVHLESEVESGSTRDDNDFGNYGFPALNLTKTNNYKGQVVSAGTKITYTLVVTNTGKGLASDVEIVDVPPIYDYFDYGADTGLVSCNGSTPQSLSATGTNPYVWTMPVNLLPGQSCTLNYTTTINDSDKTPGTHGNIASARALGGNNQTYFSNSVIDPFTVGSDSDFSGGVGGGEEAGDVLGASTTTGQVLGASTGTPSLWSLLGLLFIALGLALRLPKNSLKKLIPAIFLIISPFVILPSAYAQTESSDTTPPSVSIVKLPPYKNTNSFEISYTALDASQDGLKDVVLRFRREGGSWQDLATYTSTAAKFLLNSSHIIQDDRYYFQAYACDHAGNCASDETSTIVDRELPPAPESFQKAWKDEYAYILKWHNPSSTQSYKVYIYRYHEPVFIAQDASLIAVLDVTPNTDIEWQNSHPEPKPYYYAIRNVDPAGNTSGLVSDPETTATTTTSSSQSAPEGTPVTGSESFSGTKLVAAQSGSGQILGEQDSQDEDQNEEGSEVSPDSDAINQVLDQATPEDGQDSSSSILWRILIIIAVGIILIYIFYIRKK